jgi:hypothetical protein
MWQLFYTSENNFRSHKSVTAFLFRSNDFPFTLWLLFYRSHTREALYFMWRSRRCYVPVFVSLKPTEVVTCNFAVSGRAWHKNNSDYARTIATHLMEGFFLSPDLITFIQQARSYYRGGTPMEPGGLKAHKMEGQLQRNSPKAFPYRFFQSSTTSWCAHTLPYTRQPTREVC